MNVGCSGFGLSCKANKCSDAETGGLGVLATHETSPWFSLGGAGSRLSILRARETSHEIFSFKSCQIYCPHNYVNVDVGTSNYYNHVICE